MSKKTTIITGSLLLGLSVATSIVTSTYASKLVSLQREIAVVEKENRELALTDISAQSLTAVSEKASELGFVKPSSVYYVQTTAEWILASK